MQTPTQKTRLLPTVSGTARTRYIIHVDKLLDGTISGVQHFLQPFRCFTVHGTLAFNLIAREMQDKHPCFKNWNIKVVVPRPRTTKPTSEVLARIGIGPPLGLAPHSAN